VSSAEEENMALARRFLEARIKGDLDTVYEMMTPTSSATLNCFPTKSLPAKATYGRPPNSMLPSPTAAYTSRSR
jgi:hypothetical protein